MANDPTPEAIAAALSPANENEPVTQSEWDTAVDALAASVARAYSRLDRAVHAVLAKGQEP